MLFYKPLGRALEVLFADRFGKNFSKVSVAVTVADVWWQGLDPVPAPIQQLIEGLLRSASMSV